MCVCACLCVPILVYIHIAYVYVISNSLALSIDHFKVFRYLYSTLAASGLKFFWVQLNSELRLVRIFLLVTPWPGIRLVRIFLKCF